MSFLTVNIKWLTPTPTVYHVTSIYATARQHRIYPLVIGRDSDAHYLYSNSSVCVGQGGYSPLGHVSISCCGGYL